MRLSLVRTLLLLGLLVTTIARAQETVMKLAHPAPPTSSFQVAAELLDANVKKRSNGTLRLEIIAGGTLGNIPQTWSQVRAGTLDMTLQDLAAVSVLGEARSFRIVNVPYLFRDADHYWGHSSSGPWLERIRVPTLLLNARNDPFLPEAELIAATRKAAACVVLEFPRTGGHAGFFSEPFPGRHGWLAQRLFGFLES